MDQCELLFEVVDESPDSPAQDPLSSSSSIPFDRVTGVTRHVGLADKLQHRFIGPFRIFHKSSDVTYAIEPLHEQHDGRRKQRDTVHVLHVVFFLGGNRTKMNGAKTGNRAGDKEDEEVA
ncbi:hypothetical protein HPB47_003441 [Ixodes persulcatus]|uniref:Uncharacterized protein n=1 Tax=Ixodes persulcatus TaxID=34615 RepID=A0AC60PK25_IXOPE|nr:hypothetical protein HPB47_003441 [Ixodes persulcatus]